MSRPSLDEIANHLKAKRRGSGYMALCPAHNDRNPSLSLQQTADGKILFYCFAGCSQEDVREQLIEMNLWFGGSDDE